MMKIFTFAFFMFFSWTISLYAIELRKAEINVIAVFPIGVGDGALRLNLGEPYEPETPTQIFISKSGDTLIMDYYQGIVVYDSQFKYKETLKTSFYNRVALSDSILIAWNSDSSIPGATIWRLTNDQYQLLQVFEDDIGGGREIFLTDNYIFYRNSKNELNVIEMNPYGYKQLDQSAASRAAASKGLSIIGKIVSDSQNGIVTESAELFFLQTSEKELVYAQNGSKRDTVNIAMGIVFAMDLKGNRYINYTGDGKSRLAICDKSGNLIKVNNLFEDGDRGVRTSIPCLDPEGNIYYLESRKSGHKLIKIKKTL